MGVVTGITMSFQFGTNWPGYMQKVGNIAGPLLAYEVLTAFFLEATFLGVMLFGMNRVPGWMHVFSAAMVAFGTTVSAFWILALNSWMQTPAGHVFADGQWIAVEWLRVIFNPSFPYRLAHMLTASGLTAAFALAGLSAWRLLHAPFAPGGRTVPRWLLWAFAAGTFIGWIATLAGWLVTEIGRQPWLVTGILRTAQAVGEASGAELGASFTGYVLTYALLLIAYLVVLTHMA